MSWRKYFTPKTTSNNTSGSYSPLAAGKSIGKPGPATGNFSSYLPDVYIGSPNRVERYGHYDVMDLDSEVNAGLDILAEFCTQKNKQNGTTFAFNFNREATNSEITILSQYLKQWFKIQKFETRMFQIVRNVFKYGDEIFLRDPETKKLYHIDLKKVRRIIVNESEGKTPQQYVVSDINFNFQHLVATEPMQTNNNITGGGSGYLTGGVRGMVGQPNNPNSTTNRFNLNNDEVSIDAEHIVHISLSEGLDNNYPFGNSLLETIFKVYKQKELLEDAIIIYRVQRAPERRVFYVDVGNMPSHLAMQFVERVKTEIHQRRIPSKTGGGNSIDSTYNPLCVTLDTRIPLLDGHVYSLSEIIDKFENGETLWAYSCNPSNGKSAPGKIDWAGVTRTDTSCIRITFENGKTLTCTPDHKFPVYNQGEIQAKDLDSTCALFEFDPYKRSNDDTMSLLRIVSKEIVENRNTGTLTIDYDEVHHDYHNFAIEAGVYIKNSINEDFFFPQTSEGRGSKVETLPGGNSLGEVTDLKYFTNKLVRGLRIPSSYLPTGDDDGTSSYNDGRVGTAYIQELRFNNYCERLQGLLISEFDQEFKRYLLERGVNIDTNMFDLSFEPPQNFASYRQAELDNSRVPTFTTMSAIPFVSNRFAMKRFLGLSDEEIAENESLWREENDENITSASQGDGELRDAGVSSAGLDADMGELDQELPADIEDMGNEMDDASPDMGGEMDQAPSNNESGK